MFKSCSHSLLALFVVGLWSSAQAAIIGVSGPTSSAGTAAAMIGAPMHVLDDVQTNTGMQGFDEAQMVTTTAAHGIDSGGPIAIGTVVDSHMIFLNNLGNSLLTHTGVVWTFDRNIIGVMSDSGGTLEAASTFELGNPATNYTVTFSGSGPAAPFNARGLEGNDGYTVAGNKIRVNMRVTEPGDWIRVVTSGRKVPEPSTWLSLVGLGLVGFVGYRRSRRAN